MGRFRGKAVFITGGSRGIGRAAVEAFCREGASVGTISRDARALELLRTDASRRGYDVDTFPGDVCVAADVSAAVSRFACRFGKIDILVNNAGSALTECGGYEPEKAAWVHATKVHLLGTFQCCQSVERYMLTAQSGKIVNIASVRGLLHCGREGIIAYSAAKAGVISLTMTLAKKLAPTINVNCVSPGATDTPAFRAIEPQIRKGMIANTPFQRAAKPEEIADAILFLSSDDASFITGHNLVVDGGYSLKG